MGTDAEFKAVAVWALTGRTGMSSKAIAAHLLGLECDGSYPHDGGDFGRCEKLLEAVPSFRERLTEMTSVNKYWAAIAPRWGEIRSASDKYEKIKSITRPIEDEDLRVVRLSETVSIRF